MRFASVRGAVRGVRSSPGKKRARVAVGIGAGVAMVTLGPFFADSAAHDCARAIWPDLVAP